MIALVNRNKMELILDFKRNFLKEKKRRND